MKRTRLLTSHATGQTSLVISPSPTGRDEITGVWHRTSFGATRPGVAEELKPNKQWYSSPRCSGGSALMPTDICSHNENWSCSSHNVIIYDNMFIVPVSWLGYNQSSFNYRIPCVLGRCKQKQRGLRGLLCCWPSITEWEVHITAQGPRLRNDLCCVEWYVKLYYTIPYHPASTFLTTM